MRGGDDLLKRRFRNRLRPIGRHKEVAYPGEKEIKITSLFTLRSEEIMAEEPQAVYDYAHFCADEQPISPILSPLCLPSNLSSLYKTKPVPLESQNFFSSFSCYFYIHATPCKSP